MREHSRYLSRRFSEDDVCIEISVKISGECDEAELLVDWKKFLQKWSRRTIHHGGSKMGYCIELKESGIS